MEAKLPPSPASDRCELFDGRLVLAQPRAGYRFSVDSLLLAWWVAFSPEERILDAGCGVGVVALTLACLRDARRVTGVERQDDLSALARANVAHNGAAEKVQVLEGDLRHLPPSFESAFDVVCANPPFREMESGRVPPEPGRAAARHELTLTLDELAEAASFALRPGGRCFIVHQPRRLGDFFAAAKATGLRVEKLRFVQPRRREAANLVLAAARKGGGADAVILPPLVIYADGGEYGPDVAAIYRGENRPLYDPLGC